MEGILIILIEILQAVLMILLIWFGIKFCRFFFGNGDKDYGFPATRKKYYGDYVSRRRDKE